MRILRFRGVNMNKHGSWCVSILFSGKRVHLGSFRSFEEAKSVRLAAEIKYFGEAFDRREIEIDCDVARIPLHGQRGKFYGWASIDLADLEVVKNIAWTLDKRGYVVGRPSNFDNAVPLHRWLIFLGKKCSSTVDHRDRDKLNNQRKNLRVCTQNENSKNTSLSKNNTSGAKGVSAASNGNWRARIWLNRKEIHIGNFSTVEAASAAYDQAALRLHGEFASPNMSNIAQTPCASVSVRNL